MAQPRRSSRPAPANTRARTGSFARFFVIALIAILVGAFLAWRIISHLG